MPLHKPHLTLSKTENGDYRVVHNCDGSLNFGVVDELDEKTARLLEYAIEEGKRRRSEELRQLLGIEK